MTMANAVPPAPMASALWFPGKKMEVAPLSARALEIAKSREELLGLLRDLPDSELELSLTDLVEKEPPAAAADPAARKTAAEVVAKERRKRRSSSRSSFGSSGDGVLLNLYLPAKLTRSHTATPTRPGSRPSIGVVEECRRREISLKASSGCWPALWERGRGKTSRRQKLQS